MQGSSRSQLRELLRRQTETIGEEAVRSGGQVSAEQVETLGRLARLIEISAIAKPRPARKLWYPPAMLALTLLILSAVFFARLPETEIELDLTLSELSFGVPATQVVVEEASLSALGASGLREIRLPWMGTRDAEALVAPDGAESAIQLAVASAADRRGTLNLEPITAPAGTRVWLRHTGIPNQYRVSLKDAKLNLHANVHGPVLMALPGTPAEHFDAVSPKAIVLEPGSGVLDLDLTFQDLSRGSPWPPISVNHLSFFHVDQLGDTDRSVVRRVSTILSGTLYLESLDGLQRVLRTGEEIRFGQTRGEIRAMRLHEDRINLRFRGHVRDMRAGSEGDPRSLMPTWLEWLRARHGLSLLWGSTFYVFGLIIAALRWLRIRV
jgi:hypothetical protein